MIELEVIEMKREIEVFDYAGAILSALPTGVLVVTEAEECVNAMTIGWGSLGIEWGAKLFTIHVRLSRFTRELLDRNGEFVVSVPYGEVDAKKVKKALGICGSKSGRDCDKIALANLTAIDAELVRPPAIKEFPLTLECKVVFSQEEELETLDKRFFEFYPEVERDHDNIDDHHITYCGEIVKAYIIE